MHVFNKQIKIRYDYWSKWTLKAYVKTQKFYTLM